MRMMVFAILALSISCKQSTLRDQRSTRSRLASESLTVAGSIPFQDRSSLEEAINLFTNFAAAIICNQKGRRETVSIVRDVKLDDTPKASVRFTIPSLGLDIANHPCEIALYGQYLGTAQIVSLIPPPEAGWYTLAKSEPTNLAENHPMVWLPGYRVQATIRTSISLALALDPEISIPKIHANGPASLSCGEATAINLQSAWQRINEGQIAATFIFYNVALVAPPCVLRFATREGIQFGASVKDFNTLVTLELETDPAALKHPARDALESLKSSAMGKSYALSSWNIPEMSIAAGDNLEYHYQSKLTMTGIDPETLKVSFAVIDPPRPLIGPSTTVTITDATLSPEGTLSILWGPSQKLSFSRSHEVTLTLPIIEGKNLSGVQNLHFAEVP